MTEKPKDLPDDWLHDDAPPSPPDTITEQLRVIETQIEELPERLVSQIEEPEKTRERLDYFHNELFGIGANTVRLIALGQRIAWSLSAILVILLLILWRVW